VDDTVIRAIEDAPALAPIVGTWIEHEWRRLPIHKYLRAVASRRPWRFPLPRTLVAVSRLTDNVIGTVSLLKDDMETRPDLNPWIGCLFVLPEWRHRGLGAALVGEGEKLARRMHLPRLYLFAAKETALYWRLGWTEIGRESYEGSWTTLMVKELHKS